MGLLKKLKSTLGLASTSDRQETTVTVEYEPDAESESAVKGTDEPAAAGTDAAGSTDSITEEPPESPEDEAESEAGAVEPGEAAGPTTAAAEPESVDGSAGSDAESEAGAGAGPGAGAGTGDATESVESAETGDDDVDADADAAADADADESLQTIDGIGSAYAERLREAGIETVGDLRGGDATALAEETGLSEKRIERWIDRAGE